jgi:D-alanine transaminase
MLYLDGEYLPLSEGRVSVNDRGFVFGDGVYEVVKVLNGRSVWAPEHLARLRASLSMLRIENVFERHPLDLIVSELVRRSDLDCGIVYLQVTRGVSPRGFEFPEDAVPTVLGYARPMEFAGPDTILRGITAHPLEDFRWGRCDIKCLNLLAAIMAKEEARRAGAQEVLWLAPEGTVREGGSCNLFAFIDGVLRTHPADRRVLAGITRHKVLGLASGLGLAVCEQAFTLEEMLASGEAFLTASTRDVLPVVAVGGRPVGAGRPGPVTLDLAHALRTAQAREVGLPVPAPLL